MFGALIVKILIYHISYLIKCYVGQCWRRSRVSGYKPLSGNRVATGWSEC